MTECPKCGVGDLSQYRKKFGEYAIMCDTCDYRRELFEDD